MAIRCTALPATATSRREVGTPSHCLQWSCCVITGRPAHVGAICDRELFRHELSAAQTRARITENRLLIRVGCGGKPSIRAWAQGCTGAQSMHAY